MVGAKAAGFQKRIVHQKHIWQARVGLAEFQKLSVQLRETCHPMGAKNWSTLVSKSFGIIRKLSLRNSREVFKSIKY
jgi:hypothetical protein